MNENVVIIHIKLTESEKKQLKTNNFKIEIEIDGKFFLM